MYWNAVCWPPLQGREHIIQSRLEYKPLQAACNGTAALIFYHHSLCKQHTLDNISHSALTLQALPLVIDRLADPITAVLVSVVVVLIFGEIIPQVSPCLLICCKQKSRALTSLQIEAISHLKCSTVTAPRPCLPSNASHKPMLDSLSRKPQTPEHASWHWPFLDSQMVGAGSLLSLWSSSGCILILVRAHTHGHMLCNRLPHQPPTRLHFGS